MELEVKELLQGDILDAFVKQSPTSNFMQSWNWSQYQQEGLGRKTFRLGFYNEEQLIAVAICYEVSQTFGKYLYCSRGPILKELDSNLYTQVLNSLRKYFEGKEYIFLKIDPSIEEKNEISQIPLSLGFRKCINYVQPETPWFTDLKGNTEEELLDWCKENGMGKNYPTYIRKARHSGIEIEFSKEQKDWDLFHTYLKYSGQRKEFEVKSKRYHIGMWECLGKDSDILRLGIAKRNGKILAMIVISSYGDEVSALYSAQTGVDSRLRATMLLRWECMLLGQREGFKRFNSWGVLPEKKYTPKNPGFGYSQYKRGFGGYLEEIERTYEYVFNKALHPLQKLYDFYLKLRYYRFR